MEHLNNIGIQKKATFLHVINKPNVCKFFNKFFLNTEATDETFQQFGKQDSFRQVLKSSTSMYESSVLRFFKTTTGI